MDRCSPQVPWAEVVYMVWKIGFDLVYQNNLKQGG